jgi:dihydrofolate synthase/folylpolyglutamate synthase
VAVVTNVGLDHTDLAGPTRADVAREKAGIVEPGATLVLGERDPGLRPLFEAPGPSRVLTAGRELSWSRRRVSGVSALVDLCTAHGVDRDVPVTMPGRHQCDNLLLAVAAAEELLGAALDAASVRRALAGVWLPGRGEIAGRDPLVMLDGAHNAAGLTALRATVAELRAGRPDDPAVLVCGVLRGRDLARELRLLAPDFDRTIVCAPDSPRGLPAPDLASALSTLPGRAADVITDPAAATRAATATAGRDKFVLVTGSMHLLAQARAGLPRTGPFPGA